VPSLPVLTKGPSLAQRTRDPQYFDRVLHVMHRVRDATNSAHALDLLHEITARIGAEVSLFVSFIPEDRRRVSYRLLLDCDTQFLNEYDTLSHDDNPWLGYARSHLAPLRGNELLNTNAAERAHIELAERFGFRSSVIAPAPASAGLRRTGVLCFGSSVPGYFESDGYLAFRLLAQGVAMEFHEWWVARLGDGLSLDAALDDQDREILALEAEGMTSKQIARRLSVSIACADSRVRRVREKLRVRSRHAALRIALEYGLIPPATPPRKSP
jgi:DNA-binding CsgD family transcriptional regulator